MAFLNITTKVKKDVLKALDRNDYFHLSNSGTSRQDLYNFALALGYKRGYPTDLTESKDSLVREEYVNNCKFLYSSLYYSEHINKGHKEDLDDLIYSEKTFPLADRYANTGFDIINDLISSEPDEVLVFKLIQEMDEMYQEFKNDISKDK